MGKECRTLIDGFILICIAILVGDLRYILDIHEHMENGCREMRVHYSQESVFFILFSIIYLIYLDMQSDHRLQS